MSTVKLLGGPADGQVVALPPGAPASGPVRWLDLAAGSMVYAQPREVLYRAERFAASFPMRGAVRHVPDPLMARDREASGVYAGTWWVLTVYVVPERKAMIDRAFSALNAASEQARWALERHSVPRSERQLALRRRSARKRVLLRLLGLW